MNANNRENNVFVETHEFGRIIEDVFDITYSDGYAGEGYITLHDQKVRVIKTKHSEWREPLRLTIA